MKAAFFLIALCSAFQNVSADSSALKRYPGLQVSAISFFDKQEPPDYLGIGFYVGLKSYRLVSLTPSFGLSYQHSIANNKYRSLYSAELGENLNVRAGKYVNLRGNISAGINYRSRLVPLVAAYAGIGTSIGSFDASIDIGFHSFTESYAGRLNLAYIFNQGNQKFHPIERKHRLSRKGKRSAELMAEGFFLFDPDLAGAGQGFRGYFSNDKGEWTITPGIGLQYLTNSNYTFQSAGIDLSCSFERNYSQTFSWKMGTTVGTYAGRMFPGAIPVYEFLYTGPSICHEKLRFSFDIGLAHFENLNLFGKLGFGVRL